MTTLIVGSTGATGKHVVQQLLDQGKSVRAITRSKERLLGKLRDGEYENLTVIEAPSLLDIPKEEMVEHVRGCEAVVSCLGHAKIYKDPKRLVTDTLRNLCEAVEATTPETPTKVLLMGSDGVNRPGSSDAGIRTFGDKALLVICRLMLPPHRDNEDAAAYLTNTVGKDNKYIEWSVVRPANLTDNDVEKYELLEAPTPGLMSGYISRASVASCFVDMIVNNDTFNKWKFKMPAQYNLTGTK